MRSVDFSIVVPVYNSEKTLEPLFERASKFFIDKGRSFQIIFVDDGSNDESWKRINDLKCRHGNVVKAIKLAQNSGQQKATLCGINFSEGKIVITIDDDLQVPPEEMEKLLATYEQTGADLIYGVYDDKKHSLIRNIGSNVFNFLFSRMASTTGKGSSFRLLTAEMAGRLRGINQKYLLLDEVLQWFTNNIGFCKVEHHKRLEGKSGYSIFTLISITFKYVIYYTVLPLRLMTYIGFFFSLFAFIVAMIYVYRWLLLDVQPGFTTTILAIFFSTSIILFSLGIIGEYISRIYVQEISKPPYVVKEIL